MIGYDKGFDRLWNLAIREKEEEIRNIHRQNGRILQLSNTEKAVRYINIRDKTKRYDKTFRIPTFPEHFFLASSGTHSPIFHFLSEYFDGKTPAQIKGTLYPLIDQAKRSFWNFSKKKKRNYYSKEQKAEGVALMMEKINKKIGIMKAIAEIAEQTGIHARTLRNWFYKYKSKAIALVIERKKELESFDKAIAEVAEKTGFSVDDLTRLFYQEHHEETIALVIEKKKEMGVEKAFAEVAKQTKISVSTLRRWFDELFH